MNTMITILAQTKSGSIIEIIVLLIIAGCIAYLTSFFYYKSIYTKKIKILESEKEQLNNRIDRLNNDIMDLEKKLKEKEKEKKE